jgi:hypothetical protein
MTGLLSPFIYSLPPVSFFLDLVAMAALRRRMQVLRKIWPDKPLPPPLVISFFLITFLFFFFLFFFKFCRLKKGQWWRRFGKSYGTWPTRVRIPATACP